MKTIITYLLILLPLIAEGKQPVKAYAGGSGGFRNAVINEFSQNESTFESEPAKSMEANRLVLDRLIKESLSSELKSFDPKSASTDEVARMGLLHFAYGDDINKSVDLIYQAAANGNAVCSNFLGAMMFYDGDLAAASEFISLAIKSDPYYLPGWYNRIMLLLALNPNPDKKARQEIIDSSNLFYRMLATRCDPEKTYSYPDYRMMEIMTNPRVTEDSHRNRKYYMRGQALLGKICNVVPDYNPPVVFKSDGF